MEQKKIKRIVTILLGTFLVMLAGCNHTPVSEVNEQYVPVKSNISKYNAPERTIAPEPQESTSIGCG